MTDNVLKIEVGEKLNGLGLTPVSPFAEPSPYIVPLGPALFLVVLQAGWSNIEIENFQNEMNVGLAEIDDILDIVIDIDGCIITDVAYNAYISRGINIEYKHLNQGEGFAFNVVMVDENVVVKSIRICSLYTDESNTLIDILNKQLNTPLTNNEYNEKITKLYNEMSIEEIKANCFITRHFTKTEQ